MPLTIDEIIEDGGEAAALIKAVRDGAAKLPTPLTAGSVARLAAAILPELGDLVDQTRVDIAD